MFRHKLARVLAVTTVAIALTLCAGAAVRADTGVDATELLMSDDGVHFTPRLERGVFDGPAVMVPGDTVRSDLWVRNPSREAANLRVSVKAVAGLSASFSAAVSMSTWDSTTRDTRTASLANLSRCDVLVPSQVVAAGETVRLALTLSMGELTGTDGQGETAAIDIMVAMRDADAGPLPASACDDDGVLVSADGGSVASDTSSAPLPRTGGALSLPLIAGAALAIGVGSALVAGRRRSMDPRE